MPGLSPFNEPMTAAQINARLAASGLTLADNRFTLTGSSDATKLGVFELDGLTTATTRTYTLPNASGTLALLSLAQTFSALQTYSAGLTVSAGTAAVQALTATTGVFSSTLSAVGLSSSSGLTVSAGTTAVQALTATAGVFTSGDVTLGASALATGVLLKFNAAATVQRGFSFQTAGNTLWSVVTGNTESGANVGADIQFVARTDAGAIIDVPLQLNRAAGTAIAITRPVTLSTASSGLTIAATSGTTLTISSTNGAAISCAGGATLTGKISLNTSYAWDVAAYRSVQLGLYGATYGSTAGTNGYITGAYHNGTNWLYAVSFAVAQYEQNVNDGSHIWRYAAAGTAGNTVTLTDRMKLTAGGSLLVGTTTDGMTANGSLAVAQDLAHRGTKVGFNNATPVTRPSLAAASGTATRTTYDTTTVTLPQLAERVKAIIDDLRAYGLEG